uniref:helix-turn-helix domain-containing protein n=1 Tax=Algoriphagus sp. TaxID=1872435 RepID=UPI002584795B|nr:helix-turn-helix domain-containing protein [Algoriphagus sp.]
MPTTFKKPTTKEQTTAKQSVTALREITSATKQGPTMMIRVEGKSLSVPTKAVKLLEKVLDQMALGNSVQVTSIETELTTQQAADLLNVSRPHLVKLLDTGKIPFRKVGSHRKVSLKDLQKYEADLKEIRRKGLDFLVKEAQEMGLGY